MNPGLRPGTAADLAALTELEAELFGADAWTEQMLADELGTLIVAETDGNLVGYATYRIAGDLADLTRLAVLSDHRRAGIGRALLQRLKETAGEANRMLLEVSAENEAALKFYAAEGFVEIDRRQRYYRDGSDALVLRLPLGPACGGG
jgi:ribosomal-protein-alanine N-acetyltransferase